MTSFFKRRTLDEIEADLIKSYKELENEMNCQYLMGASENIMLKIMTQNIFDTQNDLCQRFAYCDTCGEFMNAHTNECPMPGKPR